MSESIKKYFSLLMHHDIASLKSEVDIKCGDKEEATKLLLCAGVSEALI